MKTSTFIRLALLGPIVLPILAWLFPGVGVAALGMFFTVGIMYYGTGYAIFAVAVLVWLERPRSDKQIIVAILVAPVLAAPLLAASVVISSLIMGTGGRGGLREFLGVAWLSLRVGYFYTGLTIVIGLFVAFSSRRRPGPPLTRSGC
jgi:hypothetical protein